MVHLADAPLTDRTVVRALGLDAAALGAFEDDLSLFESHPLNIFFGSVAPGHCALSR